MMADNNDLDRLAKAHPAWQFGVTWDAAASGPDRRHVWARQGNVILVAWSEAALAAYLILAEA